VETEVPVTPDNDAGG